MVRTAFCALFVAVALHSPVDLCAKITSAPHSGAANSSTPSNAVHTASPSNAPSAADSAASTTAASGIASPPDTTALHLRVGTIKLDAARSLHRAARTTRVGVSRRGVVQFQGHPTAAQREAVRRAGLVLGQYLPANAFIVSLPANYDPAAQLAGLDFVRWIGTYDPAWKLDPEIGKRIHQTAPRQALAAAGQIAVVITLFSGEPSGPAIVAIQAFPNGAVYDVETVGGNAAITASVRQSDLPRLSARDDVQFIEESPELTPRNSSTRWIIQSNITNLTPVYANGITGAGQIMGIIDGLIDQNHCSFAGKIVAYNAAPGADPHGTHVAATAVGDAGINDETRGVAYGSQLVFNTVPAFTESGILARLELHRDQGARIHTNSWGDDATTAYDGLCRGIDSFSYDNEDNLVVFAVTDETNLRNPENAKNLLAVTASGDTPLQEIHCTGGSGPTSDGRRKPEINAPGCSIISASAGTPCGTGPKTGTSMACPAVAGAAALVRQYFIDGYYPSGTANAGDARTPSGALIKAVLLNSAVNMTGIAGYPGTQEGWGRALLDDALYFPGDARKLVVLADVPNATGPQDDAVDTYSLFVGESGQKLKVTLVWTDPPATAGASFAAVNDLDLEVVAPNTSLYLGNVFAAEESATGGTKDSRNNVEQVHVSSAAHGVWTVRVRASVVTPGGHQGYALIATGDVLTQAPPLSIYLPNGAPTIVPQGTTTDFDVAIVPGSENVDPGSPTLRYRVNGGSYLDHPLVSLGGNLYRATLPAVYCNDTLEFYVSATGVNSTNVVDPGSAPTTIYTVQIGTIQTVYSDDCEASGSWTMGLPGDTATSGQWTWGDPIGTIAQPEDDHTPGTGANCFFTGQGTVGGAAGAADVDGGFTTLISPAIDLTGTGNATIHYWRWYSNSAGTSPNNDTFVVDVSNDGGNNWTNAEIVGPTGPATGGGWMLHEFALSDFFQTPGTVQLRFIAQDFGPGSLIEAAIDDASATTFLCTPIVCNKGDINNDGFVDGLDIQRFVEILLNGGGSDQEHCAGDLAVFRNGLIDLEDMPVFIDCLLAGGCSL